jgi:hypothetical protein
LSFCCLAQLSMADLSVGGSRTANTGSRPVAGRPDAVDGMEPYRSILDCLGERSDYLATSHYVTQPAKSRF